MRYHSVSFLVRLLAQFSFAGSHVFSRAVLALLPFVAALPSALAVVVGSPAIDTSPASQAVAAGANVTFTVVASGNATLTYQWQKNGQPIGGATTASLSLTNVQAAAGASYTVTVANSLGNVTSSPATLAVSSDTFASRMLISGGGVRTLASNVNATKETGEPNHAGNTGGKSVWWTWMAPNNGYVTIDTIGSSFDTLLGVYTGNSVAALATIASDDNSGGGSTSKLTLNAVAGTTYQISVDGSGAASGTIRLSVGYAHVFVPFVGEQGYGSADGTGAAARFDNPWSVAVDGSGNVYVADTENQTIRKITAGGVVTTLAGLAGSSGNADGTGGAARFNSPQGVAVDASGNVYVADTNNHRIRKVTAAGVVTTLAGSSSGSVDGTGSAARFSSPYGVAADGGGVVYVADANNHTIRKIVAATGVVTTFAGLAGTNGSLDGTGGAARFFSPTGVAVDGSGNVFVADLRNYTIRKISSGGVVTTFAGTAGSYGSANGTGVAATFNSPYGVAVDGSGNVYVAEGANRIIRKITSGGEVTIMAGTAGVAGSADGTGSAARFDWPHGVAVDGSGNVFVADTLNQTIRKITASGVVTTFAGDAGAGSVDGTGVAARLNGPTGLAIDASGNLFIADSDNHTIRKVTPGGVVTTLAGLAGNSGGLDGTGGAARFNFPRGLAVDVSGNLYVADTTNSTLRKVTSSGVVTTIAGSAGSFGSADGTGSAAQFNSPCAVAVDSVGTVYVADRNNHTIRKITSAGVVTTLAGLAGSTGSADGTGSVARFSNPSGVAVDGSGNLFVADTGNYTVRKITADGVVTTIAGLAGNSGNLDGTGTNARFGSSEGIAVDASGNLYLNTLFFSTIRKIATDGVVTTLGNAGDTGSVIGIYYSPRSLLPYGVAVDGSGNLYVAEWSQHGIRKGVLSHTVAPIITTQPVSQTVSSGATASFSVVAASSLPVTYQWSLNGAAISGATTDILALPSVSGTSAGSYAVTVSNLGGTVWSSIATLTGTNFSPTVLALSPATAGPGQSVVITGTSFTGTTSVTINGLSATFTVDSPTQITATVPAYAVTGGVVVTNANGAGTSATSLAVSRTRALANLSTRVALTAANPVVTASFTIEGASPKSVLVRAVGPSLATFGIVGFLSDPELTLHDGTGAQVAGSDDWNNSPTLVAAFANVGAFPLNSYGSDAALLVTLNPGTYTARVAAPSGGTGVVLLEVYDADSSPRLSQLATRAFVGTGADVLSVGFYISGSTPQTVLLRAIGPALGGPGTLANPTLSVFNSGGTQIGSNDDWIGSTALTDATLAVGAMPLAAASQDSALLLNLSPGWYTVQVAGVGGTTGVAQVELFQVDGNIGATKPALLVPMLNTSVNVGGTFSLSAPFVGKPGTVTFQWKKDGVAISGATNQGFSIGSAAVGDSGDYSVDLANATGTTTGAPTKLTVYPAGADSFAGRLALSGLSATAFANNAGATKETGEPSHAGNSGGKSVWWTWTAPNSGDVTLSTIGSDFNTLLGVYAGSSVTALTLVASDNDSGGSLTSKVTFNAVAGTTYQIAVDGAGGSRGNIALNLGYTYTFATFAGEQGYGSVDGTGSAARFDHPWSVAVDGAGNVYVADSANHTIRKITSSGVVTTFAGLAGSVGSTDGTGSLARFNSPQAVALDGSGNLFVADGNNNSIRRITPSGVVTTIAGGSYGSADGTGTAARFNHPVGVAVDGSGNVYVGDTYNHTVRKIASGNVVTTLAGTAGSAGSVDGAGATARFSFPGGLAVDSGGNVYVADINNSTIRKITAGGVVTTLAGLAGSSGSANGTGSAARFSYANGVAVDATGNVYVADKYNHAVRKIDTGGLVSTLAGSAGAGSADGTGSTARFFHPHGVAVDASGSVYVADTANHSVRKITGGAVTTLAGSASIAGAVDASGMAARFNGPNGLAVDASGTLYVADRNNHTIRKITSAGATSTLAGSAGVPGAVDGTGGDARFNSPNSVAVDASGNVYVADLGSHTIRLITPGGVVTTLAGTAGSAGSANGTGGAARFSFPNSVAVDASGIVYVADLGNLTIRKIAAGGVVTTLAGAVGVTGTADGVGNAARFTSPRWVAVDTGGNVYVADDYPSNTVRKRQ